MPRTVKRKAIQRPLQGGAYFVRPNGGSYSLSQQYRNAFNSANAANEARYRQILDEYQALHGRVMGQFQGLGQQERMDIDRMYQNATGNLQNSLINRGFGNSGLQHTMQRGIDRERMAQIGRLNDRLAQQRAAADVGITQGRLGVMERRYDNGPDFGRMLQLFSNLGRSGYGMRPGLGGGMVAPTINAGPYANAYQLAMMQHLANAVPPQRMINNGGRRQREWRGYGSPWRRRTYGHGVRDIFDRQVGMNDGMQFLRGALGGIF